ncbi:disease resistance protein RGA2-like [Papaver somniferum]|uniref:disease resistance protein RGA2-like n=1 Tax=Papaver somniferum TaxID=3469 RepID=UPI000E70459D|nr:disease resistance protein RGA2-like [Papaver somniferum]
MHGPLAVESSSTNRWIDTTDSNSKSNINLVRFSSLLLFLYLNTILTLFHKKIIQSQSLNLFIMAFEGVLIDGASEMLKNLVTLLGNEISLAWGVKDDLKMLKQTLEVIEAKTSDAETKQVNDAAVSLWLKMLKQVSYDADDLLDEFSYEAMCRYHKKSKFNQIATAMERFQFQTTSSGGYDEQHRKRLTTSFFGDASKFVGRKKDKLKIVKLLTTMSVFSSSSLPSTTSSSSVNSNQLENVSVISIVGMGGLGKTSLAQSIYDDKSVERYFEKKMWVCISDDFDVFKILKNIMESVTRSRCEDFSNLDVLVKKNHYKKT